MILKALVLYLHGPILTELFGKTDKCQWIYKQWTFYTSNDVSPKQRL